MMRKVYIIGNGLIGGSLALNIKKLDPETVIYGIDNNPQHLQEAKLLGIIDEMAEFDEVSNADLVVLAIPVDVSVVDLPRILDLVSDEALVIDVGSTKSDICNAVLRTICGRMCSNSTYSIILSDIRYPGAVIKLFEI